MSKYLKKLLAVMLACACVLCLSNSTNVYASSVKLNKTSVKLYVGGSASLKLNGTKKAVKWSSSNKNIASVSSKGKATAKKKGTAIITAKCNGKSYKCKITVSPITLNKTSATLNVGDTISLKLNGAQNKVTWSSSNNSIAKVSSKGLVSARKKGKVTITAKCDGKTYKCNVTINDINVNKVTGIRLSSVSKEIKEDEYFMLKATVTPSTAKNYSIEWSSSDNTIAKVENGKVTGLKEGTAIITASCSGYSASCTVKVNKNIVVKMNRIWMDNPGATYNVGDTVVIHLQAESNYDIDSAVLWLKSESNSASVKGAVSRVNTGNGVFDMSYTISDNMYPGKWIPNWAYISDKYGKGTQPSNLNTSYPDVYFYVAE